MAETIIFDQIAATPGTLAKFLETLNVDNGPWDDEFAKRFCEGCKHTTCPEPCEHEEYRNNPGWWLCLPAEGKI